MPARQRARFLGYEITHRQPQHTKPHDRPTAADRSTVTIGLHVPAAVVKAKCARYMCTRQPRAAEPELIERD